MLRTARSLCSYLYQGVFPILFVAMASLGSTCSGGPGVQFGEEEVEAPIAAQVEIPACGNGVCDPSLGETCAGCPSDCCCGDNVCQPAESCRFCPQDCGVCPPCGDGVCDPFTEDANNCCLDCSTCGDGLCTCPETVSTCPVDCSTPEDGVCSGNENYCSAWTDCPDVCGDGCCSLSEDCDSCSQDCPNCPDIPPVDDNGECEWDPDVYTNPEYCVPVTPGSTGKNEQADCGTCCTDQNDLYPADFDSAENVSACNADFGETCSTCAADCGACGGGGGCPNGTCDSGEDCNNCPQDCGSCGGGGGGCGNFTCDPGEDCSNCWADCNLNCRTPISCSATCTTGTACSSTCLLDCANVPLIYDSNTQTGGSTAFDFSHASGDMTWTPGADGSLIPEPEVGRCWFLGMSDVPAKGMGTCNGYCITEPDPEYYIAKCQAGCNMDGCVADCAISCKSGMTPMWMGASCINGGCCLKESLGDPCFPNVVHTHQETLMTTVGAWQGRCTVPANSTSAMPQANCHWMCQ